MVWKLPMREEGVGTDYSLMNSPPLNGTRSVTLIVTPFNFGSTRSQKGRRVRGTHRRRTVKPRRR